MAFIRILIAIILATLSPALAADNEPPCLTKAQAAAKYRRAHLYWHTPRQCWDNVPVGRRSAVRTQARTELRSLPVPGVDRAIAGVVRSSKGVQPMIADDGGRLDPHGNPVERRVASVFYPDLMPGAPPPMSMFTAEPVTRWPPLLDVDEMTPFKEWNERINGQFK